MACLIVTKGNQEGKYFQLGNRTLAGGRDPAREIQIVDPTVSRKHFLIHKRDDKHLIVEAKTKNGLCINGQSCSEKLLDDGDEIQLGDTVLTYYVSDQTDRTNAVDQYRAAGREFREDQTISESNRP